MKGGRSKYPNQGQNHGHNQKHHDMAKLVAKHVQLPSDIAHVIRKEFGDANVESYNKRGHFTEANKQRIYNRISKDDHLRKSWDNHQDKKKSTTGNSSHKPSDVHIHFDEHVNHAPKEILKINFRNERLINKTMIMYMIVSIGCILGGMTLLTDAWDKGNKGKLRNPVTRWLGIAMSLVGWLALIYFSSLKQGARAQLAIWMSGIMIIGSYVAMKYAEGEKDTNVVAIVFYSLGWVIFAYFMTSHLYRFERAIWIVITFSMIFSTFMLMPIQRKYNTVDGPAWPLQILGGWLPILYANAVK